MLRRLPLPSQFDRIIITGGLVAGVALAPLLLVLLVLLAVDEITAPEFVFWLVAAIVVGGALGTVLLPNIVYAALSLVATLLGVAGVYLLLGSEFLALAQVLIYGGGVVILLLFGLMLTNATDDPVVTDGSQKPFAAMVGLLLAGVIIAAAYDATWGGSELAATSLRAFGERLFGDFMVPFIIIAVLLDIALTGAYVNARRERAPAGDDQEASS
ncbi:MAG: NADH-quinone oxidoreductase subunit J [Chloroflexi bacterium]|nr:NADH-quinone oxidoreductase subunit J [Chloroflexota bacterium]